jgi:hypothetical protein
MAYNLLINGKAVGTYPGSQEAVFAAKGLNPTHKDKISVVRVKEKKAPQEPAAQGGDNVKGKK